jgi:hypothetical protein
MFIDSGDEANAYVERCIHDTISLYDEPVLPVMFSCEMETYERGGHVDTEYGDLDLYVDTWILDQHFPALARAKRTYPLWIVRYEGRFRPEDMDREIIFADGELPGRHLVALYRGMRIESPGFVVALYEGRSVEQYKGVRYDPPGFGTVVLGIASKRRDADLMRRVLASGVEFDPDHANAESALFFAVREGGADLVRGLLEAGVSPRIRNSQRETPLRMAQDLRRAEIVEILREYGARR